MSTSPKPANRLITATSPYLLQHAHNPVDWYPWGPEALSEARRLDRLILLSIGYSSCHWCHVMERESFESDAVAALMNANFINIKVDREERPDLDEIYMAATLAMNHGQGGWPMTVFLTPELEPVFAGTYFPPTDMYGRPGFPTLLERIAGAWRDDRETLRDRASEFVDHLRAQHAIAPPLPVGERELRAALDSYAEAFDPTFGGFGPAPKFPGAVGLSLLLRLYRRLDEPHALRMVTVTLDAMANGGMYDHVGGGFARYSTDARWLVPHFEKMLYDNATLARTYLEAYQVTDDELYTRVARETLDYVLRDMTAPEGGFYSSTDADSEGVEGKFFVWTPEEIAETLDEDEARLFCAYYDITPAGNWEAVSIPNTPRPLHAVAQSLGIDDSAARATIERARSKVFEARERRERPGLDDKILTAWNGLMISAFAEAYRVLGDDRYLEAAERATTFLLSTLRKPDGRLLRTYRAGTAHLDAYLEDYAYFSEALIDLYEAGGRPSALREAQTLLEIALADFGDDESGAFFSTSRHHEKLVMRYRDGADGATPAANAAIATALARSAYHLDRRDFRDAAIAAIAAYGRTIERVPRAFAKTLCAVDFLLEPPIELAIVGRRGSSDVEALQRAAASRYLPNRIQAIYDPEVDDAAGLPLVEGKRPVGSKAALYICRDFACEAPITDPAAAERAVMQRKKKDLERGELLASHVAGRADPQGTRRYADRFGRGGYRRFGSTDLTASIVGFGAYRVDDSTDEHRAALEAALSAGINLVDTSTNYADGGSERLIGSVIRELIKAQRLARDEVIVVSKIGYVQGSNYRDAREREAGGKPYPEMVKIEQGLWHCIHPEFLEDQLQRSLDRLGLATLDVCLLHNPEYFLSQAGRESDRLDAARDEFYRRLQNAFAFLERQVALDRLGWYGMSSNTAASPASGFDAPSLARTLDAARAAGGENNHFRVLELPLNLFESGAVLERASGPDGERSVLDIAAAESVGVLANRPLNAFAGGTLVRLADAESSTSTASFVDLVEKLGAMEDTFRERIAPEIKTAEGSLDAASFFSMADRLVEIRTAIQGLAHFSQLEAQIRHTVTAISYALDRQLVDDLAERWKTWRDGYLEALDGVLGELRVDAFARTRARNEKMERTIDPLMPEKRRAETLSRKALWVVASTPGVTCVLNGMRTRDYVEDAIGIMGWAALDNPEKVYRSLREEAK